MDSHGKLSTTGLGGVDVILGLQWLHSLGVTEMDWKNLTMSFFHDNKKIVIKGDPSLTKTQVSLKNLTKSWTETDTRYLIECRILEAYKVEIETEENNNVPESILTTLKQYNDVFDWPKELPHRRDIEHHIHIRGGADPVNVRPYRYAFQ